MKKRPGSSWSFFLVRERGLEPPQDCSHYHLKVARLPFRHSRPSSQGTELAGQSGKTSFPALPANSDLRLLFPTKGFAFRGGPATLLFYVF
jgi:hypothetical protein